MPHKASAQYTSYRTVEKHTLLLQEHQRHERRNSMGPEMQNMGIDSGTVLEEEHEQGRQRPLSEASREHKRRQGQGNPCQPAKRPSGIIPLFVRLGARTQFNGLPVELWAFLTRNVCKRSGCDATKRQLYWPKNMDAALIATRCDSAKPSNSINYLKLQ
ncbi:uncharacterized protein BKA55DRAFT_540197 [Fusarium redolens]|uniref:Uncharacterized protein n=1 Tax=Fusarium redolens TaxID=48865 RepID=A0A9P9K5K2_FUSRE|nr:uncharacterized protein BKA55DRAFT_540197 [Fusarium redolens]KAH7248773.1 hypothetical protein BKA55DRAFT_540197 [Fusarium redolens]